MPCRDYDYEEQEANLQKERMDNLVRYLCQAMKVLEEHNLISRMHDGAVDWWKDHKAEDERQRKLEQELAELEKKRQAALKKLSKEERRLLGLRDGPVI